MKIDGGYWFSETLLNICGEKIPEERKKTRMLVVAEVMNKSFGLYVQNNPVLKSEPDGMYEFRDESGRPIRITRYPLREQIKDILVCLGNDIEKGFYSHAIIEAITLEKCRNLIDSALYRDSFRKTRAASGIREASPSASRRVL